MPQVTDGGISAFAQGSRTGYQNNPIAALLLGGYKGYRDSQNVQMDQEQVALAQEKFNFLKQQKAEEEAIANDQWRQVMDVAQLQYGREGIGDREMSQLENIKASGGTASQANEYLMGVRETKEKKAGELKGAQTYIAIHEPEFFEDEGSTWKKAQEYLDQFEVEGGGMDIETLMDNLTGIYEPHKSKSGVAAAKAKTQMEKASKEKRTVWIDNPDDESKELPLFEIPEEAYGDGENLTELMKSGERGMTRAIEIKNILKKLYDEHAEELNMTFEEFVVKHAGWKL